MPGIDPVYNGDRNLLPLHPSYPDPRSLDRIDEIIDFEIGLPVLRRRLKQLPHTYKQVYLKIYKDGLSEYAIAADLKITRKRVRDIKKEFRRILSAT